MTQPSEDQRLEHIVDRALRDLPPRRAPVGLEARVLDELRRRAMLPWWRLEFARWPLPARCMLVVVCCSLIGLTFWDRSWQFPAMQHVTAAATVSLSWANPAMGAIGFAVGMVGVVERSIPVAWFYVGLGYAALLYAILFGLGAAAYRTLYLQPLSRR